MLLIISASALIFLIMFASALIMFASFRAFQISTFMIYLRFRLDSYN
jgi:hypothetical protein